MNVITKVSVFESSNQQEIQLIKSKLEAAGIESEVDNSYLSFMSTPTATNMMLKVDLREEPRAFEIIDAYLQENQK
ncbi:DUF2007 domain-containing protein [Soonwooa sp.]|uniref:DUF2007 domain-containing protein n=1 Tax=Soonwooa sp. TaxID=1938592 RepID=UPI0028AF81D8|nr:DUF2007 domain-containing protein [Soonwooa sp.]